MNEDKEPKSPKFGKRKPIKGQPLTEKQELHAQGLAAGLHFVDAYRRAYDTSRMKEICTYKLANRKKNDPKIVARVKELKEQIAKALEAKLAGQRLPKSNLPAVNEAAIAQAKAQKQTVERMLITRQSMTDMMLESRSKAHELGQISAAVASEKAVCQLHGLISDSRENKGEASDIERMSVDQLRDYIRGKLPEVGLAPEDVGLDFIDMKPVSKVLQ